VCAVADEVLVNVALNRSSFQSSTYGNHGAQLANDGITHAYSYVQSEYQTAPWWAVDLGTPKVVYQVNFTNTAQPYGRLSTAVYCLHCLQCFDAVGWAQGRN